MRRTAVLLALLAPAGCGGSSEGPGRRASYVTLKDGSILESRDGARSWKPVYAP